MSRNVCQCCAVKLLRLTQGSCRSSEDTNAAIVVAQRAFNTFQHTAPKERARILQKWFDLMIEHQETLAKILMYENGRPIAGARQEIKYAAGFFDWFRGEAVRSYVSIFGFLFPISNLVLSFESCLEGVLLSKNILRLFIPLQNGKSDCGFIN